MLNFYSPKVYNFIRQELHDILPCLLVIRKWFSKINLFFLEISFFKIYVITYIAEFVVKELKNKIKCFHCQQSLT